MPPVCSLKRTVRQVEPRAVGKTHASSVDAVLRSRVAPSGTVAQLPPPSNDSALPYLPEVHVVAVAVPSFPRPDESATAVPDPSSNAHAPTRAVATYTLTGADVVACPAASRAIAVSECVPFASPPGFQ